MEVTKAPPPGAGPVLPDAAAAPGQAGIALAAAPPAGEFVDIQPLNATSALQILIAEVRAELQLPFEGPQTRSATQTAQLVLDLMLGSLPPEPRPTTAAGASAADAPRTDSPAADLGDRAALAAVDAALNTALDRALGTVAAWRNVPPAAVETAREARTLIAAALIDEPRHALWARPEWQWLVPRIERYWRRRRRQRRGPNGPWLSDPDPVLPPDSADDPRGARHRD